MKLKRRLFINGKDKMKKIYIIFYILLILIIFNIKLFSFTYLGSLFCGDPIYSLDSQSLGMGGTGIAYNNSPLTIRNNSANLSMSDKIIFQINGNIFSLSERILDVTKTSASSGVSYFDANINGQTYVKLDSFGLIVPAVKSAALGISYYNFLDFNYINSTYKYKSAKERVGFYDLKQTGALNSISIAGSYNYKKIIFIGLGIDILKGEKNLKNIVYDYPTMKSKTQDISENIDITGSRINMGVNVGITKQVHVGCFYQTQPTVSFKGNEKDLLANTSTKKDYEITYPQRYGIGMAYEFLIGYNTTFACDFIFTPWKNNITYKDNVKISSVETSLRGTPGYEHLNNSYEMHLGAEHMVILKTKVLRMPIRYGLLWVPHYLDDRVELVMITFGLGFEGPYFLDFYTKIGISVGIGKRNFIGNYGVEPYDPPVGEELKPRVDESIQNILISLSLGF